MAHKSFFHMIQFKKYLLAPLFPILLQADQATVASEEAAQGFQSDFDFDKALEPIRSERISKHQSENPTEINFIF